MYLIINLGLKSIRGIIFDREGEQIYAKAYPVHTSIFKDNVEQDVDEWMELLKRILVDISTNTDLASSILRITATTSSSCITGFSAQMKPLTKVLMVSDKRAKDIQSQIVNAEAYSRYATSEDTCSTSSLVPKALWFKENKSGIFNAVSHWLGAGEVLNHFFTGKLVVDPLNASKAFYGNGRYNEELLTSLSFPVESLAQVHEVGTFYELNSALFDEYGFNKDCKFVLTTYDAICAVLGSSNGEEGNACDVSGTVTSVRLVGSRPAEGSVVSPLLCQPIEFLNKCLVGASNNMGGGIIEWYKQAFYASQEDDVYSKMSDQAQASRVGAGGVMFLPYLLGERAPFVNNDASATFFGINRSSGQNDFTRAVFESTAYVTNDLVNLIESANVPVSSLTVSGGLARFDLINQIKSDVTGKVVNVVENFESTSIGAYILVAIADGDSKDLKEASKAVIRNRMSIQPSEKKHAIYQEYFAMFKDLNASFESFYTRHKKIQEFTGKHVKEIMQNL
jgi:xylulokinase